MFSFRPFSKVWSRRAVSHSTSTIHTIAKTTMQRTELDESDSMSLLPAPSGEIAHSRIHGGVQTVVQEDAEEEEEEEEVEEEEEEEIQEWISISQTKINEQDNKGIEDETTSQNTYLPTTPPTTSISSPSLPSPPSTPTTSSSHLPLTHIGTDSTIITHMTTMLSRLERSQETDFIRHRQEAEFMYSDPWIMLERAEAELRDRVMFLLRGVLYGPVVE